MSAIVLPAVGMVCFLIYYASSKVEWFYIYEDRIESRCALGKNNVVYFENVKYIEFALIQVDAHMVDKFYIFNDGRVNTKKKKLEPFNNESLNLRINKTKELEQFIKETLKIEIIE